MPYREVWVEDDLSDYDDDDLIEELERRNYHVVDKENIDLNKLRQSYLLDTPEQFRKFVEKMLNDNGLYV